MNALVRAGTTILNAMAFANAGNDSACRALLRRFRDAAHAQGRQARPAPGPGMAARALARRAL